MNRALSTFLGAMMTFSALATTPIEVTLWPDGVPNPVENRFSPQHIKEKNLVLEPVMVVYPAPNPRGLAVIACPGGGYGMLASDHEGYQLADWFNNQGITYAVLLYRMPQGNHDVSVSDAHQAIRIMRQNAAEWGSQKVGIMGFSAGGHLASTAATHYDAETRPDFQILFYPVISMDNAITHDGTRYGLLGENPSQEMVNLYSNELQVTPSTPPAFIMHCTDDDLVPIDNALRYADALARNGVNMSLNVYPTGGHGWGFNDSFTFKPLWTATLAAWFSTL